MSSSEPREGTRGTANPGASLMGAQSDNIALFKNKQFFKKNEFLVKWTLID